MSDAALTITVHGTPAPQGSKRHVGNGVMVESSKKVKPWRQDVKHAALEVIQPAGICGSCDAGLPMSCTCAEPITGPVPVSYTHLTLPTKRIV